ncbi:MAG: glycoside hydrolase family 99-like domain-containing protein [Lachnospiraceae bacterium]|nr:glycoside hydrolase family 99-like domain-containing protein [Lachnospiraceae bacterium]
MKKYAIFLPQFHEIEENNEWWGKGFTEWVNVKRAKALYKNHCQPKHPLNNNYYNLMDKKVAEWQTSLLNEYKIDGMIYYHYYFNGKKLLEKPVENLLLWKDIKQPFFFCWANHSWVRSWNGTSEMLMEQSYGKKDDWETHFQYLLKFFKDERYEKVNNKPMFMLFRSNFEEKEELFKYFNVRCREEGFNGLYLIESYHGEITIDQFNDELCSITSLIYYREPAVTQRLALANRNITERVIGKGQSLLRKAGFYKKPVIIDGNRLMRWKINNEPMGDKVGHGLWFEWDNTPRHKHRGYIITPYEKKYFQEYINLIKDEEFLFLNAWNEWAEGMMIEPTEENGYKYLEWIKESN